MGDFFTRAWAVADSRNWTDNRLLDELLDVLEREPREVQDRITKALENNHE